MLTIQLRNDRSIHLNSFFVDRTYAGLLEGRPNVDMMNRELVDNRSVAIKLWPWAPSVTLELEELLKNNDPILPRHFCCGLFVSYMPTKNPTMDASHLAIVWYQDEVPPLASESNMALLMGVDWESLASDFEY
jgi:hypothetical protein